MANVILLRRPRESNSQKTGLGRYSDSLEYFLTNNHVNYSVIEIDMSLSKGYLNALLNGLIRPFFKILFKCRKKDAIVHATDELCGYLFPFVAGKRIVTVHHVPIFGNNKLWSFLTNISLKHSEKVVAISSLTKDDLEKFSMHELDISIINNNISPCYHYDSSVSRTMSVGVVAQLSERKNIKASIDAFKILMEKLGDSGCTLYICGTGVLSEELHKYVNDKGLSQHVSFVEHLTDDEMVLLYNKISLLFNTSMQEGFGMTTLEANICGTPSLYLKGAKIPDVVLGGSIACDDVNDMAEKAYSLLTDSEKYAYHSEMSLKYANSFGDEFNNEMKILYELKDNVNDE